MRHGGPLGCVVALPDIDVQFLINASIRYCLVSWWTPSLQTPFCQPPLLRELSTLNLQLFTPTTLHSSLATRYSPVATRHSPLPPAPATQARRDKLGLQPLRTCSLLAGSPNYQLSTLNLQLFTPVTRHCFSSSSPPSLPTRTPLFAFPSNSNQVYSGVGADAVI